MLYTKNGKNWQWSLEEVKHVELLTHDGRRMSPVRMYLIFKRHAESK